MPMGDRGYADHKENYVDSYVLNVNGSTATAINSSGQSPYLVQPIALFGVIVSVNPSVGSGMVSLHDVSATGDASLLYRVNIASAASQVYEHISMLTRPITFDKGIMVSATTVSGTINLLYKNRYS